MKPVRGAAGWRFYVVVKIDGTELITTRVIYISDKCVVAACADVALKIIIIIMINRIAESMPLYT